MPPNPPSKAHGFATCKFPNLKKNSWPPPSQILGTPLHLPDIRHAFAQQSLKYCLIKHLNTEEGYADMVHNTSFKNYIMDIKHKMINNYNAACTIRNCYVCELI